MNFPGLLRKIILLTGDVLLYYLALFITLIFNFGNQLSNTEIIQHIIPFSCLLPLWIGIFALLDGYNLKALKEKYVLIIKIAILCLTLGITSGLFFYIFINFGITPKTNLAIFSLCFGLLIYLERRAVINVFSNYLRRKIVFIGRTTESELLIKTIDESPQLGWQNKNLAYDDASGLINQIINQKIDNIVIADEKLIDSKENTLFYKLFPLDVSFSDLPTAYEMILKRIPINSVDPKWFLSKFKEGKKQIYDQSKRIFDLLVATLILLITLPLWPLIALIIKIEDGGPILFVQKRMGKDFQPFRIYKFRTMIASNETQQVWTSSTSDPRITKIGRILRYFHIDEIPQMINIIKGNISLVGPRPESLETISFLEKQIPYYHLRHLIKPGFTGWAQVNMAGVSDMEKLDSKEDKIQYDFQKVENDLYYIKNRSIFFDLLIIAKTIDLLLKKPH